MRTYHYPPFATKLADGSWRGSDHDYAKALANELGCKILIVEAPWARGIDMLKSGKVDMMLEVSKTKQRAPYFYFVGPQRLETIHLVTRANEYPKIKTWQQLSRMQAVLMRQKGSYFGEKFNQVLQHSPGLRSKLVELPNSQVRMSLLDKGRIDGFLVDSLYINYLLNNHTTIQTVQIHPLVIHQNPVYFAFSKATVSQAFVERARLAFEKLKNNGELEKIASRHSAAGQYD